MVILDQLVNRSGDVRALLGQEASPGMLDLSDDAWDARDELLRGLRFHKVRFANTDFFVQFGQCRFEASEFLRTRSNGHFWGGFNSWEACLFAGLKLRDAFSSVNTFRNCVFTDATVTQYAPYQTLFENCSFTKFNVTRMRAELILNSTSINRDLDGHAATVLFRGCKFEQSIFKECYFAGVAFENCTFIESEAVECDFSGAAGSLPWSPKQSGDPVHALLDRVLHLIHECLGADSASAQEMQRFIEAYRSGDTRDLDFADRLREVGKASGEWKKISGEVVDLVNEYF